MQFVTKVKSVSANHLTGAKHLKLNITTIKNNTRT